MWGQARIPRAPTEDHEHGYPFVSPQDTATTSELTNRKVIEDIDLEFQNSAFAKRISC
jgi:hypothetical protein